MAHTPINGEENLRAHVSKVDVVAGASQTKSVALNEASLRAKTGVISNAPKVELTPITSVGGTPYGFDSKLTGIEKLEQEANPNRTAIPAVTIEDEIQDVAPKPETPTVATPPVQGYYNQSTTNTFGSPKDTTVEAVEVAEERSALDDIVPYVEPKNDSPSLREELGYTINKESAANTPSLVNALQENNPTNLEATPNLEAGQYPTIGTSHTMTKKEYDSGLLNINGRDVNWREAGITSLDAQDLFEQDVRNSEIKAKSEYEANAEDGKGGGGSGILSPLFREKISAGESGAEGYDAIVGQAKKYVPKGWTPSGKTFGEVIKMQKFVVNKQKEAQLANGEKDDPSKRSGAMGNYQYVTDSLIGEMKRAGLKEDDVFSPENQDKLAVSTLKNKRPALREFFNVKDGKHTEEQINNAMLAAAKEWASFPVPKDMVNGKGVQLKKGDSYHSGVGTNKASSDVSPADVRAALMEMYNAQSDSAPVPWDELSSKERQLQQSLHFGGNQEAVASQIEQSNDDGNAPLDETSIDGMLKGFEAATDAAIDNIEVAAVSNPAFDAAMARVQQNLLGIEERFSTPAPFENVSELSAHGKEQIRNMDRGAITAIEDTLADVAVGTLDIANIPASFWQAFIGENSLTDAGLVYLSNKAGMSNETIKKLRDAKATLTTPFDALAEASSSAVERGKQGIQKNNQSLQLQYANELDNNNYKKFMETYKANNPQEGIVNREWEGFKHALSLVGSDGKRVTSLIAQAIPSLFGGAIAGKFATRGARKAAELEVSAALTKETGRHLDETSADVLDFVMKDIKDDLVDSDFSLLDIPDNVLKKMQKEGVDALTDEQKSKLVKARIADMTRQERASLVSKTVKSTDKKIAAAATTGALVFNGLSEGTSAGNQTRDEILAMPFSKLAKSSDTFKHFIGLGFPPEDARALAANTGAAVTAVAVGLTAAVISKATGAGSLEGNLGSKGVPGVVKAPLIEGVEEGLQGTTSQIGSNLGTKTFGDKDKDVFQDVGKTTAESIVAGAGTGAVISSGPKLAGATLKFTGNTIKATAQGVSNMLPERQIQTDEQRLKASNKKRGYSVTPDSTFDEIAEEVNAEGVTDIALAHASSVMQDMDLSSLSEAQQKEWAGMAQKVNDGANRVFDQIVADMKTAEEAVVSDTATVEQERAVLAGAIAGEEVSPDAIAKISGSSKLTEPEKKVAKIIQKSGSPNARGIAENLEEASQHIILGDKSKNQKGARDYVKEITVAINTADSDAAAFGMIGLERLLARSQDIVDTGLYKGEPAKPKLLARATQEASILSSIVTAAQAQILGAFPDSFTLSDTLNEAELTDAALESFADINQSPVTPVATRKTSYTDLLTPEQARLANKVPEGHKRDNFIRKQLDKGDNITAASNLDERYAAEDMLNNPNATDAELIAATLNLERGAPFNDAQVSDVNKQLAEYRKNPNGTHFDAVKEKVATLEKINAAKEARKNRTSKKTITSTSVPEQTVPFKARKQLVKSAMATIFNPKFSGDEEFKRIQADLAEKTGITARGSEDVTNAIKSGDKAAINAAYLTLTQAAGGFQALLDIVAPYDAKAATAADSLIADPELDTEVTLMQIHEPIKPLVNEPIQKNFHLYESLVKELSTFAKANPTKVSVEQATELASLPTSFSALTDDKKLMNNLAIKLANELQIPNAVAPDNQGISVLNHITPDNNVFQNIQEQAKPTSTIGTSFLFRPKLRGLLQTDANIMQLMQDKNSDEYIHVTKGLSVEDRAGFDATVKFVNSLNKNIDKTMVKVGADGISYQHTVQPTAEEKKSGKKPYNVQKKLDKNSFLYDLVKNGKMDNNLTSMISAAALDWFNTSGYNSLFNNEDSINKILGRTQGAPVSTHEKRLFSYAGSSVALLTESLGDKVAKSIGSHLKDIGFDGTDTQLIAQLGTVAFNGLMASGMVDVTYIEIRKDKTLDAKTATSTNKALQFTKEQKALGTAQAKFLKPKLNMTTPKNEDGTSNLIPALDKALGALSNSPDILNKIFGLEGAYTPTYMDSDVMPSAVGKPGVSKIQASAVDAMQNFVYEPHTAYIEIANKLSADFKNRLIDEVTPVGLEHIESKVSNQAKRNAIQAQFDGADNIVKQMLDTGSKGVRWAIRVGKNKRMTMTGSNGHPQGHKYIRHAFKLSNAKVTIDPTNVHQRASFFLAVTETFGVKVETMTIEGVLKAFADEVASNKDIMLAAQSIASGTPNMGLIETALGTDAETAMKLEGLISLADYVKADGKPFETFLYKENDGITNGAALGLLQYSVGSNLDDFIDRAKQVGLYFDNEFDDYGHYKSEGGKDTYESTLELAKENITSIVQSAPELNEREAEFSIFGKVAKQAAVAAGLAKYAKGKLVYTPSSDHTSDMAQSVSYFLNGDIFSDGGKGSALKDVDPLAAAVRSLIKNPLMIFLYGSGMKSIKAAMAYAIQGAIVKSIEEANAVDDLVLREALFVEIENRVNKLSYIQATQTKDGKVSALDFKIDRKAPLEQKMPPQIFNDALAGIEFTYGRAIEMALEAKFGEQRESVKIVIDASSALTHVYKLVFNAKKKEVLAETGQERLTLGQVKKIKEEISAVFPIIATSMSDDVSKDGIVVAKNENTSDNGKDSVRATDSTIYMPNATTGNPTKAHTSSRSLEDPGVSIGPISIQAKDATNIAKTANDGHIFGNVHDAIMASVHTAAGVTQSMNKHHMETGLNDKITKDMLDLFSRVINSNLLTPEIVTEANKLIKGDDVTLATLVQDLTDDLDRIDNNNSIIKKLELGNSQYAGGIPSVYKRSGVAPTMQDSMQWAKRKGVPTMLIRSLSREYKGAKAALIQKDSNKALEATQYIGAGTHDSSTQHYNQIFDDLANTGKYVAEDVVFISANGNRGNRFRVTWDDGTLTEEYKNIDKAIEAGSSFVTDNLNHVFTQSAEGSLSTGYNVGEAEIARYLISKGYSPDTSKEGMTIWSDARTRIDGTAFISASALADTDAALSAIISADKALNEANLKTIVTDATVEIAPVVDPTPPTPEVTAIVNGPILQAGMSQENSDLISTFIRDNPNLAMSKGLVERLDSLFGLTDKAISNAVASINKFNGSASPTSEVAPVTEVRGMAGIRAYIRDFPATGLAKNLSAKLAAGPLTPVAILNALVAINKALPALTPDTYDGTPRLENSGVTKPSAPIAKPAKKQSKEPVLLPDFDAETDGMPIIEAYMAKYPDNGFTKNMANKLKEGALKPKVLESAVNYVAKNDPALVESVVDAEFDALMDSADVVLESSAKSLAESRAFLDGLANLTVPSTSEIPNIDDANTKVIATLNNYNPNNSGKSAAQEKQAIIDEFIAELGKGKEPLNILSDIKGSGDHSVDAFKTVAPRIRRALLGSSAQSFSDQHESDAHEFGDITKENTMAVFYESERLGVIKSTSEHQGFLASALRMALPTINAIKFSVGKTQQENHGSTTIFEDGGAPAIELRINTRAKANNIEMSAQELYVHEILHTMFAQVDKGSYEYKRIRQLQKTAVKHLKPEHFLTGSIADADINEVVAAKARYDYVMNNYSENARKVEGYLGVNNSYDADPVEEFAVMGLSNLPLIKALQKMEAEAPAEVKGFFNKLTQFVTTLFERLYNRVKETGNLSVHAELVKMTEQLVSTENGRRSGLFRASRKATGITSKYTDKLDEKIKEVVGANKHVIGGKILVDALKEKIRGSNFASKEWAGTMLNEFAPGRLGLAAATKLLSKSTLEIERKSQLISSNTQKYLEAELPNLTDIEKKALYTLALKGDIQSIWKKHGSSLDDVIPLLEDQKVRSARINELQTELLGTVGSSLMARYMSAHAEDLGYHIVTGHRLYVAGMYTNAIQIVRMQGYHGAKGTLTTKVEERAIAIVDELASLHAIQHRREEGVVLANLFKDSKRKNGVNNFLDFAHFAYNDSLDKTFNDSQINQRKGYVRETTDSTVDMVLVPISEVESYENNGYTQAGTGVASDPLMKGSEKLITMVNRHGGLQRQVTGVVSLMSKKSKGTNIFQAATSGDGDNLQKFYDRKRLEKSKQIALRDMAKTGGTILRPELRGQVAQPIFDDTGAVTGYRYMMGEQQKADILSTDTNPFLALGSTVSSTSRKVATIDINKAALDFMHETYVKEYAERPNEFILLSESSANKKHRDAYNLLPFEARDHAKNLWGSNKIYVRREQFNIMFGFRKWSIAQLETSTEEMPTAYRAVTQAANNLAVKLLKHKKVIDAEQGWQSFVAIAKDTLVIKSGIVTAANIISNLGLLWMKGVNPAQAAADHIEAYTAATEYAAVEEELYITEIKAGSISATPHEVEVAKGRISVLRQELQNSPIHKLMEAGVYQTIVDDVETGAGSNIVRDALEDKLSPYASKLPAKVRTLGSNILMRHDTKMYKVMRDVAQMSDFAGRYSLDKKNLAEGMTEEESIRDITTTFINYDAPTSKTLQYMNDIGLAGFTKYLFRVQNVILTAFGEHPTRMVMQAILQAAASVDVADITDSILGINALISRFFSPLDILEWANSSVVSSLLQLN
jgi:hypothetical protein